MEKIIRELTLQIGRYLNIERETDLNFIEGSLKIAFYEGKVEGLREKDKLVTALMDYLENRSLTPKKK